MKKIRVKVDALCDALDKATLKGSREDWGRNLKRSTKCMKRSDDSEAKTWLDCHSFRPLRT